MTHENVFNKTKISPRTISQAKREGSHLKFRFQKVCKQIVIFCFIIFKQQVSLKAQRDSFCLPLDLCKAQEKDPMQGPRSHFWALLHKPRLVTCELCYSQASVSLRSQVDLGVHPGTTVSTANKALHL